MIRNREITNYQLELADQFFHCTCERDFRLAMDQLNMEVPFDHSALFYLYVGHRRLLSAESLWWDCDRSEFERMMSDDKLMRWIPPLLNEKKPDLKELINYFFITPNQEELVRMKQQKESSLWFCPYAARFKGCFVIYRVNPILYCVLFLGGNRLKSSDEEEWMLRSLIPIIHIAAENSQFGRAKFLSEQEFEITRLREQAFKQKEFARYPGLSLSQLRQSEKAIKEKTGFKQRYERCEKKPGEKCPPLWFDRGFTK